MINNKDYLEKEIILQNPIGKFNRVEGSYIYYVFDVLVNNQDFSRLGFEVKIPLKNKNKWYQEIEVVAFKEYIDLTHVLFFKSSRNV